MNTNDAKDSDIQCLSDCCEALSKVSPEMVKSTLVFLWDKFVENAEQITEPPDKEQTK